MNYVNIRRLTINDPLGIITLDQVHLVNIQKLWHIVFLIIANLIEQNVKPFVFLHSWCPEHFPQLEEIEEVRPTSLSETMSTEALKVEEFFS